LFLNQVFLDSKTVSEFEFSLVVYERVKSILVSSVNQIGVDLLFTKQGKLFL
jgi:hypothetical protein